MNKTRPNRVYFRVSDKELEQINKCVQASGKTRQDWLMSVVTPLLIGGDTDKQSQKTCPICGSRLNLKNGYRGKFWGCSNYPICRYTEDWKE